MNLSKTDLELLSHACQCIGAYYREIILPRLRDWDLETLLSLGYDPPESEEEEEAAFVHASESIRLDVRKLRLLAHRLCGEIQKAASE